jgi:hypothetical protein
LRVAEATALSVPGFVRWGLLGLLALGGLLACGEPCRELQAVCDRCVDPNLKASCELAVDEQSDDACEQNIDNYDNACD